MDNVPVVCLRDRLQFHVDDSNNIVKVTFRIFFRKLIL